MQARADPKGVTILIHYDITVNVAGGVPMKDRRVTILSDYAFSSQFTT